MSQSELAYDVVVVGAGNAALCAALSAREQGARVVVLEKAPPSAQGGNCPYTGGGFRFLHEGIEDLLGLLPELTQKDVAHLSMAPYTADSFREHLLAVTHGDTDPELMEALIAQSRPTVEWMHSEQGVKWELPVRMAERAPSVIPNSVGLAAWRGGPGLLQMLTTSARRKGIAILYETKMLRLLQDSRGGVCGVIAQDADGVHKIRSKGVVLACGGFEANPEMRAKYLGPGWERARVRGSRYNTGDGHRAALDVGAKPFGQWTGCHATPIDVNAPATGSVDITERMPRRSYPIGIMVNLEGRRFLDEGEGFAEQTFVKVGKRILEQERGIAFQIFDGKAAPHLEQRYGVSKPVMADSIRELAEKLHVNPNTLAATVDAFNAEAHDGEYDPRQLDGRATSALYPPKSNWAIRLDKPPFTAFAVTGGITYTYGGLRINPQAQVLDMEDRPIRGLFAAGEIVGGIFYHNSLRAAGLMHGAVFGKLAGANAATAE
jgi:tricarballylate dehydrogenase